jgi:putative tricarboxylic transport membrane protein
VAEDRQARGEQGRGRAERARGLVHGVDLAVAAALLVFAGCTYYLTTKFEEVASLFAQDVPPEFLPRLLVWTIVVLSIPLPFEHLLKPGGRAHFDATRSMPIARMAYLTAGLLTLIVLSVKWASTYLAIIAVCVLLPLLWGERRWKIIIPYALVFPTVVMLLFSKALGVYFEPGLLGIDFR